MGQQKKLREYQLVELMLKDRGELYAEFLRIMGQDKGPRGLTDRDIIRAILEREFPRKQREPHQ
jgi:hypothetical protein